MALTNFTELKAAIASWAWMTGNTDFTDAVPDFIILCESELNRRLRTRDMETSASITITSGSGSLPSDYLEMRELKTSGDNPRICTPVDPIFGDRYYNSSTVNDPFHYSIVGATVNVYPPTSSDTLTAVYYQTIPDLATNSTNWLLTKSPNTYLYGSLIHAAKFMEEREDMMKWRQDFEDALRDLRIEDDMYRYAKAQVRPQMITP